MKIGAHTDIHKSSAIRAPGFESCTGKLICDIYMITSSDVLTFGLKGLYLITISPSDHISYRGGPHTPIHLFNVGEYIIGREITGVVRDVFKLGPFSVEDYWRHNGISYENVISTYGSPINEFINATILGDYFAIHTPYQLYIYNTRSVFEGKYTHIYYHNFTLSDAITNVYGLCRYHHHDMIRKLATHGILDISEIDKDVPAGPNYEIDHDRRFNIMNKLFINRRVPGIIVITLDDDNVTLKSHPGGNHIYKYSWDGRKKTSMSACLLHGGVYIDTIPRYTIYKNCYITEDTTWITANTDNKLTVDLARPSSIFWGAPRTNYCDVDIVASQQS